MHVLSWALSGLFAGFVARFLLRTRSAGWLADLILGTLGGLLGGWIFRLGGISGSDHFALHIGVALFGAVLILGVARRLGPAPRHVRAVLGDGRALPDLQAQILRLGELERRVLAGAVGRLRTARDPNATFDEQLTFGQRIADRVATFGGSWGFIGAFLVFMMIWMIVNTETPRHFDPFPFILLNLLLSCLAALQAPVILMSQNRQAAKDRHDAKLDYEVNLRAESDLMTLHGKFDELREREWNQLFELQRRQIELLERLLQEKS